jgi:F-type H+-transporting ATPase subunit b
MGDLDLTILAAEEGGGQSNFLIPNGTFFFVLLIFLIVLGVIAKWVVPPISKVLHEREVMVQKTAEDNRRAAQLRAAADADYRNVMNDARREATNVREQARADGRKIVDDARARANVEVSSVLQQATEELTDQSRAVTAELQTSVENLATNLASRVLGVEVTTRTVSATTGQGR